MKITLNNEIIDFKLTEETKLVEVIQGVKLYLEEQNHVLKSWRVNGNIPAPNWEEMSLSTVDDLTISSLPCIDEEFANLQLTADFFVLLHQSILENNTEVLNELCQEFAGLFVPLDHILGLSFHKGFFVFIQSIKERSLEFLKSKNIEVFEPMTEIIQTFLLELNGLAQGLGDPEKNWAELKEKRSQLVQVLPQVSVQLSSGQDKKALDTVLNCINHLETLAYFLEMTRRFRLDFFQNVSPAVGVLTQLNPFIMEISEAMERKDYILMGDLLEYEVVPLLEIIP